MYSIKELLIEHTVDYNVQYKELLIEHTVDNIVQYKGTVD